MATLRMDGVSKTFGEVSVLPPLDLTVADGEFCVLVGPSGCGKSTLLRIIAGLDSTSSGRIFIDDVDVSRFEPSRRGIAMVFQSYALYPHMTVARNMGFGLEVARTKRAEVVARVAQAAEKLQLDRLLRRKPRELSGGQRQRVAIGRAITRRPKIFLLDEPLSNLDAALRVGMRVEIARLSAELGVTTVYVTHDQVEAMTLADRIVVMNAGRIEQVGTPLQLYEAPVNLFVAGFIGSPAMNFLLGRVASLASGRVRVDLSGGIEIDLPLLEPLPVGAPVTLGIRPEHIRIGPFDGDVSLTGGAAVVEMLGSDTFVHLRAGEQALLIRDSLARRLQRGQPLTVSWSAAHCHLFAATGQRLPMGLPAAGASPKAAA